MTTGTIPKTIEKAKADLGYIDHLLTANEWLRAAIVYAFTRDGGQGEGKEKRNAALSLTTKEFAALGIKGLKSDNTVREYRKAWQSAMNDGAPDMKPGDTFTPPDLPWPPGFIDHRRGSHATKAEVVEGFRKMVEDDPKAAIKELIQDSPTTVPKLAKGVRTAHPGLAAMAATPEPDEEEPRVALPREDDGPDYSKDLRYAVNGLQRVLAALRDGRWEPDFMEKTLIAFLAQAFTEIAGGDKPSSVIDEIEEFLQKEAKA